LYAVRRPATVESSSVQATTRLLQSALCANTRVEGGARIEEGFEEKTEHINRHWTIVGK
jgi:hypothetical protein